tara:strand:- start:331 stop:1815 length:1485 start_codon:yes stop_codon:yes gene_type:complete
MNTNSDNSNSFNTLKLPYSFAKKNKIIITSCKDNIALVYYHGDVKVGKIVETRRFIGMPISLNEASTNEFDSLLREIYEESSSNLDIANQINDDDDLLSVAEDLPEPADLLDSNNDAPIIKFINAVVTEALKNKASDIHIEPYDNRLTVRYRIDGVLEEILDTKKSLASLIVSRIKVMSKLDIAEKRLPQDGRISLAIAGRSIDIRVSTIPSGHGERVVMRLLDKQAGRLEMSSLGMEEKTLISIDNLIQKPHGILLVTGPTGSGKTTTLYAALERINDNTRNIMTVEDPVEYLIDGIGQTQVNTKIDMTFAKGLRAILRQDPDVVMIGEIRDLETAEIAIQASLTGHLVMATLHTNTSVGAITRLRDMGIEPYLISSTLIGVVAQRLVRVLNPTTKKSMKAKSYECEMLGINPSDPPLIYHADGASGFSGRTGIYELLQVDDNVRELIHEGASEREIEKYIRKNNPSIREDGKNKVLSGITTLDEILRVTQND